MRRITSEDGFLVRNVTKEDKFKDGSPVGEAPFPDGMEPEPDEKHLDRGHLILMKPFTIKNGLIKYNAGDLVFAYIPDSINQKKDNAGNFIVYKIYVYK